MILLTLMGFYNFAEIDFSKLKKFQDYEGLNTIQIHTIIQDQEGFLWIGTDFGLIRYDGYKFKEFRTGKKRDVSIMNIRSLFNVNNSSIIMGTQYDGIYQMDTKNYSITKKKYILDGINLFDIDIRAITEDLKGNIWISSNTDELFVFNLQSGNTSRFHDINGKNLLGKTSVSALLTDKKGNIWIGTSKGLKKYDNKTKTIKTFNEVSNGGEIDVNRILTLFEDSRSQMWIGTIDGLYLFNEDQNRIELFKREENNLNSISNNLVRTISEDKKGNIWLGTNGGINIFSPISKSFINYRNNNSIKKTLGENCFILSLLMDKSGIIWIGTYAQGLYNFDDRHKQFRWYSNEYNKESLNLNRVVWSIAEDRAGNTWIGTHAGLNRFNKKTGASDLFLIDKDINQPPSRNEVNSILIDNKNNIWVGFKAHGLTLFDPEKEELIKYDWVFKGKNKVVYRIFIDSKEVMWLGRYEDGLIKFDRKNNKIESYLTKDDKNEGKEGSRVSAFYEDMDQRLWIGTLGDGLKYFDKKGNIRGYKNNLENPDSISSNVIMAISGNKKGDLFVGTNGGGLNIFNKEKKKFKSFGVNEGLPGNTVYGILKEDDNNLWLSTNKGISRFNISDKSFQNFGTQDGLQHNEFNFGAYFKNKKGEMYFGGSNGINFFDPKRIISNSYIPNIVITGFRILGNGTDFDQDFILDDTVNLNHKDSFLLEFSALSFSNPKQNRYAYKVKGLHKNWIQLGTNRSITFNNLNPGEYELNIIGSNNDGIWNENGRIIKLFIKPPFWLTLWFKILLFFLILILIYNFMRNRLKRLEKKLKNENEIEKFFLKSNISSREQEIIKLVVDGESNKKIGDLLFISTGTVKIHLYKIFKKLNISSRAQMISIFKKL